MPNPEVILENEIKKTLFEMYKNDLRIVNPLPEDKNDNKYNKAIEHLEKVFAKSIISEPPEIPKGGSKRTTRKHKNINNRRH